MSIRTLTVAGLRGFATEQALDLAVPVGSAGSGLTVLVGPNNAGKSTIIEAIRALSQRRAPSFTEGKRNRAADSRVKIRVLHASGSTKELRTVDQGGSETVWINESDPPSPASIFVVPSRRYFSPFFGRNPLTREQYITNYDLPAIRSAAIDQFSSRLFQIQRDPAEFNSILGQVLDPVPEWTIEQADSGQYYLKFLTGGTQHTSEGLGEGFVSLFFLVDALYDSRPGDIIAIDEPELSLHPSLQKKLAHLLFEFSAERQIIYATHSPYFADLSILLAGGRIARVHLHDGGSAIAALQPSWGEKIRSFLNNLYNPHIVGIAAREVFFLEDSIILVEGQEDVIQFPRIAEQLECPIEGSFFGWGVGGADNLAIIAGILKDLGFRKVAGVLDENRSDLLPRLSREFPDYSFLVIPADDVRTKPAIPARSAVRGLLDEDGILRDEYRSRMHELLAKLNAAVKVEP